MTIHSPEAGADDALEVVFDGKRGAVLWLALKTGFLSIITLGIYRFWMKSRLRRWYWSSIRIGGHPMEYTGDPVEKLLGFLIAVVFLAFYIGIVNLLLMFVSFSLFQASWVAYLSSFIGVIPLWFYATYRARRYVLARTRWRGVRFALNPGAWGYAWRALVHWAVTILSLGLLWPRMTFWLEKYKTDRTSFGSVTLEQGGRWQLLYPAVWPFVLAFLVSAIWGAWVFWLQPLGLENLDLTKDPFLQSEAFWGDIVAPERLWALPALLLLLIFGAVYYVVETKRIMADYKRANGVWLRAKPRPKRVFAIYVAGYLISYLTLVLGVALLATVAAHFYGFDKILAVTGELPLDRLGLPRWAAMTLLAVIYFAVFLAWSVLYQAFVTFPLMRHYSVTLEVMNPDGLKAVSQRARDEFAEAEGFAEALDLGAAI